MPSEYIIWIWTNINITNPYALCLQLTEQLKLFASDCADITDPMQHSGPQALVETSILSQRLQGQGQWSTSSPKKLLEISRTSSWMKAFQHYEELAVIWRPAQLWKLDIGTECNIYIYISYRHTGFDHRFAYYVLCFICLGCHGLECMLELNSQTWYALW